MVKQTKGSILTLALVPQDQKNSIKTNLAKTQYFKYS